MIYYKRFDGNLNVRKESYRNGRKKFFCKDIICFDIETTSAWIDKDGNVISYEKGRPAEYWNELEHVALPYIWMVSINDTVYYGREFSDFLDFCSMLPDIKIIIWVHNLAFEFQFLCNLFRWKSVFSRTPHKVIKCVPSEFPNIEFRCTYFLTRLSLADWGLQIGLPKMVGDLDYDVLRTPITALTDKEKGYCERDVLVMYRGISIYREKYGTLENIPLTQTGTVRRAVKDILTKNYHYMFHVKRLVPKDADEYAMLQKIFAGGYTHANRLYSGKIQRGNIHHYDFASSYPFVMLSEKFPMEKWIHCEINAYSIPIDTFSDTAYIFHLAFSKLNSTRWNTYIQTSKCINLKNAMFDNGRIISADYLEIWCTEQDYLTIADSYSWEFMEIKKAYKSKKEYLPKEFLEYLLELYHNKTALKGIPEQEALYLQSKQYINSLFGMCVTSPIQANVDFDGYDWTMDRLTDIEVNMRLNELRNPDKNETRYFLSYSWGVYVTAYARRNLWNCILQYDDVVLYADTDSIFMLGAGNFAKYNTDVYRKVSISCKSNNLDISKTKPKDKKGIEHSIGVFAEESTCSEFITLGAKRYCTRENSDGKLHLTISGINKEAVELLNDDISNFVDGFIFDKDAPCVKKKLLTYLQDMPDVQFPDGYISKYRYGINMRNNGYKLSITDEYKTLIDYLDKGLYETKEADLIAMRGRFRPK